MELEDFPIVENCLYYFVDDYGRRYEDLDDIYSDAKLLDRYSTNYTLAMYDIDTNYLYY